MRRPGACSEPRADVAPAEVEPRRTFPRGTLEGSLNEMIREAVREVLREELRSLRSSSASEPKACSEFIAVRDAARIAGVDAATIRRWQQQGLIASYKAGRLNRVKVAELHAYLRRDVGKKDQPDLEEAARAILGCGTRRST